MDHVHSYSIAVELKGNYVFNNDLGLKSLFLCSCKAFSRNSSFFPKSKHASGISESETVKPLSHWPKNPPTAAC